MKKRWDVVILKTWAGIVFLFLASVVAVLYAQNNTVVSKTAEKPLTQMQKLTGINLYQHALLLQSAAFQAQQQAQTAAQKYNDWSAATIKEAGLPPGTQLNVNLDTQDITVTKPAKPVEPPKPPEPKP